ncbi:orotate phosphoribosyltransferase [Roseospira goensis]|uniref:Orotate phosphoribosyltransferase n=1 Tax=Roseospira goensis TaxID=391922 RepID=A0A7W6WLN1_9PROT|nr:orotate phosphoribosyltransferase [Roseospira goensis]MBB4287265.1 orotate phosphoribosyltransferase [Roseospira goensis]
MVAVAFAETGTTYKPLERLRQIIAEKSLRKGRAFKLSSGKMTDYFFDMKPTMLDPEGASLIASLILDEIEKRGDIAAIGGLVLGAVPIVSVVAAHSNVRPRRVPGFFVRKEPKGHGTNQLIDGNLPIGAKVILVDDVTTTGGSVGKAVDAVREAGCKVEEVFTIVDRLEGAMQSLQERDVRLVPLLTRTDFE